MSRSHRMTIPEIRARKGQTPLVVLTAYSAPTAQALDSHCDILLVGDSVGMVLYGMPDTLGVTLDMMINHGRAAVRASSQAAVIVDLPFGSYMESKEQAFRAASRVMIETGCTAVKLEGGQLMAETIQFLTQRGIPVMGHVGLTPQYVHSLGGFKAQGRDAETRQRILDDALAVEQAGAFSLVLEAVYADAVEAVVRQTSIPVIGIGATTACDGQVLVTEDMAGITQNRLPKFVKQYANLSQQLAQAAQAFSEDVKARRFPETAQTYRLDAA